MELANTRVAARSAIGLALLAGAALLLSSGWFGAHGSPQPAAAVQEPNLEFLHSAAGIYGRLQMLRDLEKRILAHAEAPQKAAEYRARRDATRRRIDALMRQASVAATSDRERGRLEQLAAIARLADARFAQIDRSIFQPEGDM